MIPYMETPESDFNPNWNAVYALAISVAGLIASEFLPVSVLTPMARDLQVTEGIAGQAISITAVIAMVSSLLTALVTRRMDRRTVLLSFTVLLILSDIIVAFAPNFLLLILGRVLLGITIGGFWAMLPATAMRLMPEKMVPKALSVIFGAVSVATVIAAPLGSFLGNLVGWRNVFLLTAAFGVVALSCQMLTLPSMAPGKPAKLTTIWNVSKRPKIKAGMLATMLLFMGYATFFTYLRPFLETITKLNVNELSIVLLGFGLANLLGTTLARHLLRRSLKYTLIFLPFIMAIPVAGLVFFGHITILAAVLIALWGLAFGGMQVGWPTWLTRTIPEEAESAGGLQVAVIQLAITLGAGIGGIFFDHTGVTGVFVVSSIITLVAGVAGVFVFKEPVNAPHKPGRVDKTSTAKLVA